MFLKLLVISFLEASSSRKDSLRSKYVHVPYLSSFFHVSPSAEVKFRVLLLSLSLSCFSHLVLSHTPTHCPHLFNMCMRLLYMQEELVKHKLRGQSFKPRKSSKNTPPLSFSGDH